MSKEYTENTINTDPNHLLDGRRRISWQKPMASQPRSNLNPDDWTRNELEEMVLINRLNIVIILISELDSKTKTGSAIINMLNALKQDLADSALTLQSKKDDVSANNSPENIREYMSARNGLTEWLRLELEGMIDVLAKHPALKSHPLLKQLEHDVVTVSTAAKPTLR